MKICFNRLGPTGKVDNKYKDGDVADYPENVATAFIKAGLAFAIETNEDYNRQINVQNQVEKNAERRQMVEELTNGGSIDG